MAPICKAFLKLPQLKERRSSTAEKDLLFPVLKSLVQPLTYVEKLLALELTTPGKL